MRSKTRQKSLKPGAGWTHIGGPEWEHDSGARVHTTAGLITTADGVDKLQANNEDEAMRFIRGNGGDRIAGLKAWAESYNAS